GPGSLARAHLLEGHGAAHDAGHRRGLHPRLHPRARRLRAARVHPRAHAHDRRPDQPLLHEAEQPEGGRGPHARPDDADHRPDLDLQPLQEVRGAGMRKLLGGFTGLVLVALYAPIVVMVLFSFNQSEYGIRWTGFTLDWYRKLAENATLHRELWNTLAIAALSCVAATVLG